MFNPKPLQSKGQERNKASRTRQGQAAAGGDHMFNPKPLRSKGQERSKASRIHQGQACALTIKLGW